MNISTNFKFSYIMLEGNVLFLAFKSKQTKVEYFQRSVCIPLQFINKYVFKYLACTQKKMPEDAAEKITWTHQYSKRSVVCVPKYCYFIGKGCHIALSTVFSCRTLDPEYGSKTGNERRLKFSCPRPLCCCWAVSCSLLYLVFSTSWLAEKYAFSAPIKCCGLKVKMNVSCGGCGTYNLPLTI